MSYLVTRRFHNWEGAARVWFWTGLRWSRFVRDAETYTSLPGAELACTHAKQHALSDPMQVQVETI